MGGCNRKKHTDSAVFEYNETLAFPDWLTFHNVLGRTLVLAPEYANWLVLAPNGRGFFEILRSGATVGQAIETMSRVLDQEKAEDASRGVLVEIAYKEFFRNTPVSADVPSATLICYLTNLCNLRCRHCYMRAGEKLPAELSMGEWFRVIDEFASNGMGRYITLTGGEVLAHPHFSEILDRASSRGLKIQLFTNGLLLNETNVDFILDRDYEIQLSLDGPTAEINDRIRGAGTFKRILASLSLVARHLQGRNVRLCVGMTPLMENIEYLERHAAQFFRSLFELCGQTFIVRIATDIFEGRCVHDLTLVEKQEFRRSVMRIYDQMYEQAFFSKLSSLVYKPNRRKRNCGYCSGIKVLPDGSCYPCDLAAYDQVGNVRQDSLQTLRRRLRSLYEATCVENSVECACCDLKYFCGGNCRIVNHRRNGNSLVPYCSVQTKQAYYEGLVAMNEHLYDLVA
jgi:radical SAM protein with 4Fe4S-binding SPASM domain